ncbi:acyltransferase family protein [Flammeovirga sp. SJP92]|uniref:acyltransferase family protein n=1 Tax=Flammeovirga sp. SJP92 TaxID=1775430 RepID=UPI0007890231|nr:acyltransferase family protein [Flammeovirga sp. SJP92]KXX70416.1 hypothetical protein AVL50_09050 [Flammeovirga sp. SJP92]
MNNSLNPIRHFLASFIIITHSYTLLGSPKKDILYRLTNHQLSLSSFAVNAFFAISGCLIFKLLDKLESIIDYIKKKCFRIFPALWVMLLISVFIIAPFFSESSSEEHYQNKSVWIYFISNIFLYTHFKGDYSYGIFLYGFFVLQMLVAIFPSITVFNLALLSIALSFVFVYFSWHIFEEKALGLKNKKIQIWNFQL